MSARWWTAFGDRRLTDLIERARSGSPQIEILQARIARARALAAQARAPYYPRLGVEATAARRRQVAAFPDQLIGGMAGGDIPSTFESETWTTELVGSYEPSLFGRTSGRAQAADLEASALGADLAGAELSLAGEIAQAWFSILELRERRVVIEEQLAIARTTLELVELQFNRGLADALTVAQQRRRVAATRTELADLVGRDDELENQLATLVGADSVTDLVPDSARLPDVPDLPDTGVPSRLLDSRPDVVAARRRVAAADRRVAASVAEWFPRIQLRGTLGYGGEDARTAFDHVIYSGLVTVTQPIYQGGATEAGIDAANAELRESVARYADVLRSALLEVETALARERGARALIEAARQQVDAAQDALEQAQMMYERGLTPFFQLLDAQEALLTARLGLVSARQQALLQRVRLYQALGGRTLPGDSP